MRSDTIYSPIVRLGYFAARSGETQAEAIERYPPGAERNAYLSGWAQWHQERRKVLSRVASELAREEAAAVFQAR